MMTPATGTQWVRWAGDRIQFRIGNLPPGATARLRTNLGHAEAIRREIVQTGAGRPPTISVAWQDLPMRPADTGEWEITLTVSEVGWFEAKAFAVDAAGRQHWPEGPNVGISVQPSWTRSANSIYCAFPRQFGPAKTRRVTTGDAVLEAQLKQLDASGFTVIPPSGTLRDLMRELPHIFHRLGCKVLHLLPVSPTPTTFARFGRFGSPYAAQDLTAIDPALVEFDQRTNGIQQFQELTHEVHCLGGKVLIDMVINHTGWGSTLWEKHPEWFHRDAAGKFLSPGAWGTVWEDLVELDAGIEDLWRELAAAFVTWCERGVDGFRCDAGYKIPMPVWRFIIAHVRQEFQDTVFLLEGLGGSWEATESLLREGGMQWAYSELFQNHGGHAVQWYLDHAYRLSNHAGPLIHYSETHDNLRLTCQVTGPAAEAAAQGELSDASRNWSVFRNRLSALTSVAGGWGFTNGVEWLATERVNVHSARGLAWNSPENIVEELANLLTLTNQHPAFFAGASIQRVSPDGFPIFALKRSSPSGEDSVLVLANNDPENAQSIEIPRDLWDSLGAPEWDLVACPPARLPDIERTLQPSGAILLRLKPGACHCLALSPSPKGLSGEAWRSQQALADWALKAWSDVAGILSSPPLPPSECGRVAGQDPAQWLAKASLAAQPNPSAGTDPYSNVVRWTAADVQRVTLVPPNHWILIRDEHPFRASLQPDNSSIHRIQLESIATGDGHIAAIPPRALAQSLGRNELALQRLSPGSAVIRGSLLALPAVPAPESPVENRHAENSLVLLTNDRGGMARVGVDLGRIHSKYDCLLGANLHPSVPVDRHVFVKRLRAWVEVDGFVSPLDAGTLLQFRAGPPATWEFLARGGNRTSGIQLQMQFIPGRNTLALQFRRLDASPDKKSERATDPGFRLIARFDLEDRSFHSQTKRNPGAEHHFAAHTHPLHSGRGIGFRFNPAADRHLEIRSDRGRYHPGVEWSHNVSHPNEASRGQEPSGDAWSPGWFEVPLHGQESVQFTVDAEANPPSGDEIIRALLPLESKDITSPSVAYEPHKAEDQFRSRLLRAARQFVVRRGPGKTVIAGYPWFLDWGRDTLIACRGLLAADMVEDVRQIVLTFAKFEANGTLPNAIHGEDASNRDTSDAQLWFGVVCEELAARLGATDSPGEAAFYQQPAAPNRSLLEVLRSIACGYLAGTPNRIQVDAASGLVWSPSHFTWMDTNHPAGTPREGYPVEIQALWIRLLRLLARLGAAPWEGRGESWADLARRAENSFHQYFWLEECGWYADVLIAAHGHPARTSPPSNALRSNCLVPIALGIDQHPRAISRARRTVEAARQWLLVPGGLRSLAPLPVIPPLPVLHHGHLLNDPNNPYWPRYEGDEDTRRKPAYHNGTAWMWTFPMFCEALVRAYPGDPGAVAAAKSYLLSIEGLMNEGCLGQLPEITDGDAPHTQRGCDAQAWSVTEALRVWTVLDQPRLGLTP